MQLELIDPYSPAAERIWSSLEPPSFFTSWGWIENWLACLPADRAPRLAVFRDGDRVAACCLGTRTTLRRKLVPTRSLHLNTSGVSRLDELILEYNGLVGHEPSLPAFLAALPEPWDEIELQGLREDAFGGAGITGIEAAGYRVHVAQRSPVFFVDLDRVRAGGYLAQVSGQTRSQIRRAQKAAGALSFEVAGDTAHAIAIYDELCALHVAQWRAKGHPGAFSDPWIDRFHRRLIAKRFAAGEIQLVRILTGAHSTTLGCLYNFVFRGRVLQYQTGFRGSDDARDKPGYVCHTAAIEHSAAAGHAVYDFLAGDHRYKRSLSTGNTALVWCTVQRPRWRFALEDRLVELVRSVRQRAT